MWQKKSAKIIDKYTANEKIMKNLHKMAAEMD